jgi:hypothetical protein
VARRLVAEYLASRAEGRSGRVLAAR